MMQKYNNLWTRKFWYQLTFFVAFELKLKWQAKIYQSVCSVLEYIVCHHHHKLIHFPAGSKDIWYSHLVPCFVLLKLLLQDVPVLCLPKLLLTSHFCCWYWFVPYCILSLLCSYLNDAIWSLPTSSMTCHVFVVFLTFQIQLQCPFFLSLLTFDWTILFQVIFLHSSSNSMELWIRLE